MFGHGRHQRLVEQSLADIKRQLGSLLGQQLALGKQVSAATDRMNAAIAQQTTVDAGFKAAMDFVVGELRDMAANADGASSDQLNAFAAAIEANNAVATAALQEGVAPQAPPPASAPTTAPGTVSPATS